LSLVVEELVVLQVELVLEAIELLLVLRDEVQVLNHLFRLLLQLITRLQLGLAALVLIPLTEVLQLMEKTPFLLL
jgi:hypothetical protein